MKYWHYIQIALAIIFSILVFESAYGNAGISESKIYSRYIGASFLLSYSIAHLYILMKRGVFLHKALSFLPLYFIFGFIYSFASTGFIKNWAPGTSEQALIANIKYGSILAFIVFLGLVTIMLKSKNTPNKLLKQDS